MANPSGWILDQRFRVKSLSDGRDILRYLCTDGFRVCGTRIAAAWIKLGL